MADSPSPVIVLPFTLTTFTFCGAGFPELAGAVMDTLLGAEPRTSADPMLNVTGNVFAATPGTVDVTGTDAVYVPWAKDPVVARSVRGAGSVVLPSNAAVNHPVGCPAV